VEIVSKLKKTFFVRKDYDKIEITETESTTYTKLVNRWTGEKFDR